MAKTLKTIDEAAALLKTADRILVIGCSGSGKSTLSQAIAAVQGLPYVCMDRDVFWMAGWTLRARGEALERVESFVAEPRWIMDGTSPGTLPLRLSRADLVIWMRPPRYASLYGVFWRWLRYRGRTRPEMADGCPERLTGEFLSYVWHFERSVSPEIEQKLADYGPNVPVFVVRNRPQANDFIEALSRVPQGGVAAG